MEELVIISGKGGTGKTSLMASFAAIAENNALCDADVDASDLHLLAAPDIVERHDFKGGAIAVIDHDKCSQCSLCRDLCKWEAIDENFEVDPIECEGCGVCVDLCPEHAVDFPVQTCGEWYVSESRFGPMVHARLGIAEENSGKLVTLVRQEVKKIAEQRKLDIVITDGPPGVGCPVIASIGGATAVLIVTEPTVSGLHDMERVAGLAARFKVPAMVCVNKYDLNPEFSLSVLNLAKKLGIESVGTIPFNPDFTKAMVLGKTIFEYAENSEIAGRVRDVWGKVFNSLLNN